MKNLVLMGMHLSGGLTVCGDRIMIGFKTEKEKNWTKKRGKEKVNFSSAFEKIKFWYPFHFKMYSN